MSTMARLPVAETSQGNNRRRRSRSATTAGAHSLLAQGDGMIWLTGGALVFALSMILGLIVLVLSQGVPTFWPVPVYRYTTKKNVTIAGELSRVESYRPSRAQLEAELSAEESSNIERKFNTDQTLSERRLIRTGNAELSGETFAWISDFTIANTETPKWILLFEREEHGRFYGEPIGYVKLTKTETTTPEEAWQFFQEHHAPARQVWHEIRHLETYALGRLDTQSENARLTARSVELKYGIAAPETIAANKAYAAKKAELEAGSTEINRQIAELRKEIESLGLLVRTARGQETTIQLSNVVRAYAPNQLTLGGKIQIYFARWWEFLSAEPRNVNTEGGVFPAIFGTVVMTLIMSLAVAPFGVLAALYLREYARAGWMVSLVRIAINNLSGVPSIVFGVFGLGFFCYQVGSFIDGGPKSAHIPTLPAPTWYLGLLVLAILALAAFIFGILGMSVRAGQATFKQRVASRCSLLLWLLATITLVAVVAMNPHFNGFYRASLPNPTFGAGGIMWSALTLSLLTLPVVIVATEEALSAVPNSLREGSYACGAGKWQTIRRIVLPHAMPGIMTGLILAMSRGAGEVAPLMLVGALKFAPKLPIDMEYPFVHAQRPFMHLAFHIFDLGFHSPDSEAAKPTVYTTIMLLIAIVATLNIAAVYLRARLRKQFQHGQF